MLFELFMLYQRGFKTIGVADQNKRYKLADLILCVMSQFLLTYLYVPINAEVQS